MSQSSRLPDEGRGWTGAPEACGDTTCASLNIWSWSAVNIFRFNEIFLLYVISTSTHLVVAVVALHQLLLVPLEVVEQDPDGGGGDLGHVEHLLDVVHHVLHDIFCRQHLKNTNLNLLEVKWKNVRYG